MNVLKEMDAFRDWLLLNEMPSSGIVLWYSLLNICNRAGCQSKFKVPNSTLMNLTGLSKQGLINARGILVQNKLIIYEKGKKSQAPVYQVHSLVNSVDSSVYQSLYQSNTQSPTESLPIEDIKRRRRGGGTTSNDLFTVYEQNFGLIRPIVRESLLDWCEEIGELVVLEAIKLAVKKGGRTYSYVEKILEQWEKAGLTSVDDVKRHAKQSFSTKPVPFGPQSEANAETLFDELRKGG